MYYEVCNIHKQVCDKQLSKILDNSSKDKQNIIVMK